MKKNIFKISLLSLLWVVGITLYILFLLNDYGNLSFGNTIYIKYGVVISSTIFAFLSLIFARSKEDLIDVCLLTLALIFTLVSDFFLLVRNYNFELGVGIFILAQLCYFARLAFLNKYPKKLLISFAISRVSIPLIFIIFLAIAGQLTLLYALVAFYIVQLMMNFVETLMVYFISGKKRWDYLLLAVGFLLFIMCDIFVGLGNVDNPNFLNVCWIFYAPSQLLISSHFVLSKLVSKDENAKE